MSDFREALSAALKASKEPICEDLSTLKTRTPLDDSGERELTEGKIGVMLESVQESRARREIYMLTVVPGLAKNGAAIGDVLEAMAFWNTSCTAHVTAQIAKEHRNAARLWLASFFAGYTREFVQSFMAQTP